MPVNPLVGATWLKGAKLMNRWRRAAGIGAAITGVLGPMIGFTAIPPAAAAPKASYTTVASGFDNPRGIAIGEDGKLYVAEAGKGGPTCINGGPNGSTCAGLTSAISVISQSGAHHQIVTGLFSISGQGGFFATGADGLSRNSEGDLYTIMTGCPQQVKQLPPGVFDPALVATAKAQVGQVIKASDNGNFEAVAGVGRFDWNWTVIHHNKVPNQFPDCNPYGILAGEHDQWVVDAASNTLDHVTSDGTVEVKAFIPNPPSSDAVPTCLDRGPDGALYIGQLTGGGNAPGAANIWRFDTQKDKLDAKPWATGLTAVTGCGFGANGKFYATEFSTLGLDNAAPGTGAVVRVPAHSTTPITVVDGLNFPNGFAATEGSIYVSNWSIAPAVIPPGAPPFAKPGEVIRISI
jgi:hypothetical protein